MGSKMTDALCKAAAAGDSKAVSKLLKQGASARICSATGHSPLDLAAAAGNESCVTVLAKAIVKDSPPAAAAALSRAVVRGQTDVARALLSAGADPRAREPGTGRSPLHWAAFAGDAELCGALLRAGADAGAKDVTGASPADWAADRGHASLAVTLTARASSDRKATRAGGRRSSSSGSRPFLRRIASGAALAALAATAVAAAVAAHRLPQARAAARAAKAKPPKKGWF